MTSQYSNATGMTTIKKWAKLTSRYISKSPWATLRVDACELPNGKITSDYYVLEYPNWANAVAITENNEVILIKQYRHAADIISLEIPGGVIDGDEDPRDGIKRELLEETGYLFEDIELISTIYPNPATSNNITYGFLAKGGKKTQEQSLDEHEDIEVSLHSIKDVKQLLLDNKFPQALHTTALMYAFLKMGVLK